MRFPKLGFGGRRSRCPYPAAFFRECERRRADFVAFGRGGISSIGSPMAGPGVKKSQRLGCTGWACRSVRDGFGFLVRMAGFWGIKGTRVTGHVRIERRGFGREQAQCRVKSRVSLRKRGGGGVLTFTDTQSVFKSPFARVSIDGWMEEGSSGKGEGACGRAPKPVHTGSRGRGGA